MVEPHSIVVGGTRGGGRAWVRNLVDRGHCVSIVGRRPPSSEDKSLPRARFFSTNLGRPRDVERVGAALVARGPIDSLVFFQRYRGTADDWDGELAVSLSATHALIERFKGNFSPVGGRSIVIVGSVATSLVAQAQPASYHVAKAGLRQLMRYYAATLGPLGLRVNMVSPGAVTKDESAAFYAKKRQLLALYERAIPLRRMGSAQEVSAVIEFLCGPQAAYVTGQDIVVDGGLSLLWQETLARAVPPSSSKGRVTRRLRKS